MKQIPVAGPWITEKEVARVAEAAANAWYENANFYQEQFQASFAAYCRRRHAIALPSCTAALHLALSALDLKPGDEVIVPDVTWIATAAPIVYLGATPVFADIDPQTWCLDAASLEALITKRTRAVIVVNLYGGMPDMTAIGDIAARHGLALIEDAAESVGSQFAGRPAGSFGVASAFSFHGSKTLTTGEGGMLLTDDDLVKARTLILRDHGRRPSDPQFWNAEVGFKYRMSSLQAALGLAQLERVEELVERKRQIFTWYAQRLAGLEHMTLNAEPVGTRNSYWMVTAFFDPRTGLRKQRVAETLGLDGIATRPFFYPLSSLPAFAHLETAAAAAARNRIAYGIAPWAINLPSALSLTEAQVDFVCDRLHTLVASSKAA